MPHSPGPIATQVQASHVQKLDQDVLSYIFEINANMFLDDHALETTCATAQVCHAWRRCLLSTPSLWGRLIDLDHHFLRTATAYWVDRLLRCSNASTLWIKARRPLASHLNRDMLQLFGNLIEEQWYRIQRLVVCVDDVYGRFVHHSWLRAIYRPAPCLEEYSLKLGDEACYPLEAYTADSLFSNHAPLLRTFNGPPHKFDLEAPWLRGLHSLHIGTRFEMHEIITVLRMAANLEYLFVAILDFTQDPVQSLPPVYLPKLDRFILISNFNAACTLLDHIEIPAWCSLQYSSRNEQSRSGNFSADVTTLLQTLSNHAQRYFQVHIPTKIQLICNWTVMRVQDDTRGISAVFSIEIHSCSGDIPEGAMSAFLKGLALPQFAQATELKVDAGRRLPTEVLIPFFACLALVTVIDINVPGFSTLEAIQHDYEVLGGDSNIIFPALHTLRIRDLLESADPSLAQYAFSRQNVGHPLGVVDLTDAYRFSTPPFELFEDIKGLKVRWAAWMQNESAHSIWEYVCGSGSQMAARVAQ